MAEHMMKGNTEIQRQKMMLRCSWNTKGKDKLKITINKKI